MIRWVRWGVCGLVVLAPLPFASVRPWAVLTIELSAALLLTLAVASAPPGRDVLNRPFRIAVGIWLVSAAAQVSSLGFARPDGQLAPTIVDALIRNAGLAALAASTAIAFDTASARMTLMYAFAGSALFQAIYGSFEYLSGRQQIFAFPKRFYLDSATGTFINRNHFALLCVIGLIAILASLPLAARAPKRGNGGAAWTGVVRVASWTAATIIAAAVLMSFSRAGLLLAFIGAVLAVVINRSAKSSVAYGLGIATALLLILIAWDASRLPAERFWATPQDESRVTDRTVVWHSALGSWPSATFVGSGLGTFEAVYAAIQPASVHSRWDHAHNDWLQMYLEGGLIGLAGAAGILLLVLASCWRRKTEPPFAFCLVAIAVASAQAFVDFPTRIPALAVWISVLLGLSLTPSNVGSSHHRFGN